MFFVFFSFQCFCTILFTATVFYDFLLIFSGPSKSVEDLIYFFGHVCYRLLFSLVFCFKMMIVEEPLESFSLDLLILFRTLIKVYKFFASPLLLSLIEDNVRIKFPCPNSGTINSDQGSPCYCRKFLNTFESGIVNDLVSGGHKFVHW